MQDRFKFRCWNKLENKMFYVIDISWFHEEIKKIRAFEPETKKIFIFDEYYDRIIENIILMQCTGLKDKNCKLIYEGDIVGFINPYENDKIMTMPVSWESTPCITGFNFDEEYAKNVEVIGNIYENPELLKDCE